MQIDWRPAGPCTPSCKRSTPRHSRATSWEKKNKDPKKCKNSILYIYICVCVNIYLSLSPSPSVKTAFNIYLEYVYIYIYICIFIYLFVYLFVDLYIYLFKKSSSPVQQLTCVTCDLQKGLPNQPAR